MTYLAAAVTLRGEPPHNKNNQLSFDHNPRFLRSHTTLGWTEEGRGGERKRDGGRRAGWSLGNCVSLEEGLRRQKRGEIKGAGDKGLDFVKGYRKVGNATVDRREGQGSERWTESQQNMWE